VILRKSVFTEHFAGEDFANPRNTVSGAARKKHGDRSLSRHFEMYFYDVIAEGRDFATEHEKMDFLEKELGLRLAVTYRDQEIAGVRATYRTYLGTDEKPGSRFGLDYEIDGLVVRADSIARQRELGTLHNRPRFATAYKFRPSARGGAPRGGLVARDRSERHTRRARAAPAWVGGSRSLRITPTADSHPLPRFASATS
jgi:DNA ligase (NAD+)